MFLKKSHLFIFLLTGPTFASERFIASERCRLAMISASQIEGMSPHSRSIFMPKEFMLTEQEVELLELRFGLRGKDKHTLHQIGEIVGIARGSVPYFQKKALEKISNYLLLDDSPERDELDWFLKGQNDWPENLRSLEDLIKKLSAVQYDDLSENPQGMRERIKLYTPKEELTAVFALSIERLEFSTFVYTRLKQIEVNYIGDLVQKTEAELVEETSSEQKSLGEVSLMEIKDRLKKENLYLGMNIDWPLDPKEVDALVKKLTFRNPFSKEDLLLVLALPIEKLELSTLIHNSLRYKGLHYIGSLIGMGEAKLLRRVPNFGKKSLKEVRGRLLEMGLLLDMPIEWPSDPVEEEVLVKKLTAVSQLSKKELNYILTISIEKLGLSAYFYRVLKKAGFHYIGDIIQKTEAEFMEVMPRGFGQKSLNKVKTRLLEEGVYFGMKIEWPSDLVGVDALVSKALSIFAFPIEELKLSVQTYGRLKRVGIRYVGGLVQKTKAELIKMAPGGRRSLGDKGFKEIEERLSEMGHLRLGMIVDWPSDPFEEDTLVESLITRHPHIPKVDLTNVFTLPIEELNLTIRFSESRLKSAGFHDIGDMVKKTEAEFMAIMPEGFGKRSLNEIKVRLREKGVYFGMSID